MEILSTTTTQTATETVGTTEYELEYSDTDGVLTHLSVNVLDNSDAEGGTMFFGTLNFDNEYFSCNLPFVPEFSMHIDNFVRYVNQLKYEVEKKIAS